MGRILSSKYLTFIAMMAALGNVLSALSIQLSPIIPSIPVGPLNFSLALDLSHITTFIAALFGGPLVGGVTGLIGGAVAAFEFGFSKGNLVTGIGLPIGKALTGLVAGLLMSRLNPNKNRLMMVVSTVASYIPEGLFTILIFVIVYPIFFPLTPLSFILPFTTQIIIKAFAEMIIMGILISVMTDNQGFNDSMKSYFM
jgi:LytS/YehU family sensor histidine kinase